MTAKPSRSPVPSPVRSVAGKRPAKPVAKQAAGKKTAGKQAAATQAAVKSVEARKSAAKQPATRKAATKQAAAKQAVAKKRSSAKAAAGKAAIGTLAKPARANSAAGKAPVLLSGGNPQIAKGEGDAPVQAYIAAMPGWKRAVGQRLDALIVEAVPNAHKAVKWNSPFYGIRGEGWFLSFHCFDRYIKLAFFRGTSLRPMPPEPSKTAHTRYLHVYENQPFDQAQFLAWAEQASRLPGERM